MKKLNSRKSISDQYRNMKVKYNHFKSEIKRNSITIYGQLRPTARSVMYDFTLSYTINKAPRVKITSPRLQKNSNGDNIPHMYAQRRLCLYQPKYKEFTNSDFLSETIIPWISLWLYYYEQWHITGDWLGGGEHPTPKKQKHAKKR